MPDLEMLLRDVRPVPSPDWAARLDKRVAAGFPGPVPGWKKKLQALRAHFAALSLATATVGALLVIVIVIGKNVGTGGDDSASGGVAMKAPASGDSAAGESSSSAGAAVPLQQPKAAVPDADRAVLKNATLT